jgi:predicted DNA-binding transcriptional regulator YafY
MATLTRQECVHILQALKGTKDPVLKNIIKKLISPTPALRYGRTKQEIERVLKAGYTQKRNVKIQYYSLSSDETRMRTVSICQYGKGFIIAYCHLRKDERTFVTNRINKAALTSEHYTIPKDYVPESKVW